MCCVKAKLLRIFKTIFLNIQWNIGIYCVVKIILKYAFHFVCISLFFSQHLLQFPNPMIHEKLPEAKIRIYDSQEIENFLFS